jgi:phosphoribosyl-AMP cyclohydrolase
MIMQQGTWHKSTRSGAAGHCVEVRQDGDTFRVRDTKNPEGAELTFTRNEWTAFIGGARAGEFDV